MARHLITSAIPYINGIKHLGNLIGSQLPADLFARYQRARGNEVLFLCATDEHGTPAELAAAKAGKPVAEYCAEMHEVQSKIAEGFGLSFDHFGRSSSAQNQSLTQHFAGVLADQNLIAEVNETQMYSHADGRYLPDRYIEGGADKSYGIHVARLAGVPGPVIERAKAILCNLEDTELSPDGGSRYVSRQSAERETLRNIEPSPQLDLFAGQ